MKIGLNLLYLIPNKVGGTETYAAGILHELSKSKEHEFHIYCSSLFYKKIKTNNYKFKYHVIPFVEKNRIYRILFENIILPILVGLNKIDLVHSLGYTCPFFLPCINIVTIHDLNWHYFPNNFSKADYFAWRFLVTSAAFFSNHIITDSISSKESISEVLSISPEKISVVYCGLNKITIEDSGQSENTLPPYSNYILTVSSLAPHKNILRLLKAFKLALEGGVGKKLIIVGLKGLQENDVSNFIKNNFKDEVLVLGWVTDLHLKQLYKKADAFIFASLYEGFGFPILEAFYHKIPVISSSSYSLREVVGDAAEIIDPLSEKDIADKIIKVSLDPKLRKVLVAKGVKRIKKFSWENTVPKLLDIYKSKINS